MNILSPKAPPRTSHAVDCGNGHFFCWECLSDAHAPSGEFFFFNAKRRSIKKYKFYHIGCEQWIQW